MIIYNNNNNILLKSYKNYTQLFSQSVSQSTLQFKKSHRVIKNQVKSPS